MGKHYIVMDFAQVLIINQSSESFKNLEQLQNKTEYLFDIHSTDQM